MIRSYDRTTLKGRPHPDTTDEQWQMDFKRCEHCRNGQIHSEWAHEDAICEHNDKHNLWED